jgi:hypothetical protein
MESLISHGQPLTLHVYRWTKKAVPISYTRSDGSNSTELSSVKSLIQECTQTNDEKNAKGIFIPNVDIDHVDKDIRLVLQSEADSILKYVQDLTPSGYHKDLHSNLISFDHLFHPREDGKYKSFAADSDAKIVHHRNYISGFGTRGLQLYFKYGVTCTEPHDEILDSGSINYMTVFSKGYSLW